MTKERYTKNNYAINIVFVNTDSIFALRGNAGAIQKYRLSFCVTIPRVQRLN